METGCEDEEATPRPHKPHVWLKIPSSDIMLVTSMTFIIIIIIVIITIIIRAHSHSNKTDYRSKLQVVTSV